MKDSPIGSASGTPWSTHVFGVRHLSPSGAWHLVQYLDQLLPELVLVEGLSDANELMHHWVRSDTVPPFAILAYTETLPIRTLVYPLANYSPEYQAVLWAHQHKVPCKFIDLPSSIFLGLQEEAWKRLELKQSGTGSESSTEISTDTMVETDGNQTSDEAVLEPINVYAEIAENAGEANYDSYWERNFEHNLSDDTYRQGVLALGDYLRESPQLDQEFFAENLIREAYMRRQIESAINQGVNPQKIVVIVGAFHASVMNSEFPLMTDDELASLPKRSSKLTLMPYSYYRLSEQSGYGAGNRAPAYFELMWKAINDNELEQLPNRYLSSIAGRLREEGTQRSTAEVIEAVRLAKTLTSFRDSHQPTLDDLHDAAKTLLGQGEFSNVSEAIARIDVGTAIGRLPDGVSRTSIQDDFERLIRELKLDKYRTTVAQDLKLDLRENRQTKNERSAYLDLRRSTFLHRLRLLGIEFARLETRAQMSATWAEHWILQWSPESEISLVESVLLGETVELATGFKLKQQIEAADSIEQAAMLVVDSMQSGIASLMQNAISRVQELSINNPSVAALAESAFRLLYVVQFGDVRKSDVTPLLPLIRELFVSATLNIFDAASCAPTAVSELTGALDQLNRISLELHEIIDEDLWRRELEKLSDSDSRSPIVSGVACGMLLERNWLTNENLAREVSRRLSPGVAADLGAGWFEGLAMRNRYSLIARQVLWEQLSQYVDQLDEADFRRSLMFLRRAFGGFNAGEKRSIVENLANVWEVHAEDVSETMENPLSEQEQKAFEDLNEFDFDDF